MSKVPYSKVMKFHPDGWQAVQDWLSKDNSLTNKKVVYKCVAKDSEGMRVAFLETEDLTEAIRAADGKFASEPAVIAILQFQPEGRSYWMQNDETFTVFFGDNGEQSPWKKYWNKEFSDQGTHCEIALEIRTQDNLRIAKMLNPGGLSDNAIEENADLMIAAPRMLAELRKVLRIYENATALGKSDLESIAAVVAFASPYSA